MGWQDAAALSFVAVAASYLARRAWDTFRPKTGASTGCAQGCGGCPAKQTATRDDVVTIGGLESSPGHSRVRAR